MSGIVVAGVASALLAWDLPVAGLVVSGILGGAAAGLILALLTLWTTETAARLVGAQWLKHRQKSRELLPLP